LERGGKEVRYRRRGNGRELGVGEKCDRLVGACVL